ncbi:MAG TPA: hypothetical protein VGI45_01140 [Terracidiphilus sp.]|jgi:hypothetical protein
MDPAKFLARIEWSQIDHSENGITDNDCVVVLPDGHFHMERRLEQLSVPRASLEIYESTLSVRQLKQLRDMLDSQDIKALPRFALFAVPGSIYLTRASKLRFRDISKFRA